MRCIHCDSEISDDAKFCTNCGHKTVKNSIFFISPTITYIFAVLILIFHWGTFFVKDHLNIEEGSPLYFALPMIFAFTFILIPFGIRILVENMAINYKVKIAKIILTFYIITILYYVFIILRVLISFKDCGSMGFILWR